MLHSKLIILKETHLYRQWIEVRSFLNGLNVLLHFTSFKCYKMKKAHPLQCMHVYSKCEDNKSLYRFKTFLKLLDLSAAFDTVKHNTLLDKLEIGRNFCVTLILNPIWRTRTTKCLKVITHQKQTMLEFPNAPFWGLFCSTSACSHWLRSGKTTKHATVLQMTQI